MELGSGTDFNLEQPIEGLSMPPIRTSQGNFSGTDGGYVSGQFFSTRLITISGFIAAHTCEDNEYLRGILQLSLPIREDLEVEILSFAGTEYNVVARLIDFKMDVVHPTFSRFKLDLLCPSPYIYLNQEQTATIPRKVGGGLIIPTNIPAVLDAGTAPTTVNNTGTVESWPIFRVYGISHNPKFTNLDTGEKVQVNVTTSTGDILEIDMMKRTITLNGGSVIGLRSTDSSWFNLPTGESRFTYETSNGADTGTATISWRTAVLSI